MNGQQRPGGRLFTMRNYRLLWLAVVVLCLVPLLLACRYIRPSDDDFLFTRNAYAALTQNKGLAGVAEAAWNWMVLYFWTWQGTFWSVFLTALFPVGAAGGRVAGAVCAGGFGLLLLSVWSLCRALCGRYGVSRPVADCGALIALFTALCWMPSFCEGVYWFTGMTVYFLPLSVALWGASAMVRYERRYHHARWTAGRGLWLAGLCAVAFLSGGQSYVASFLCLLALGMYAAAGLVKGSRFRWERLLLWGALAIGFGLCVLAPGNAVRKLGIDAGLAAKPSPLRAVMLSIQYAFGFIADAVNLQWMALSLLFLPVALGFARQSGLGFRQPLWLLILSFGLLAAGFCPGFYTYGNRPGPLRLLNVQYLLLVLLFFVNEVYLTGWALRRFARPEALPPHPVDKGDLRCLWALLLCGAVLFGGITLRDTRVKPLSLRTNLAFMKVARELGNGSLATYAGEYDRVIDAVLKSDEQTIEAERFSFLPATFYHLRLGEDEYLPSNETLPAYYGKGEGVRVVWAAEQDEAAE